MVLSAAANGQTVRLTFPSATGEYTTRFEDAKGRPLGREGTYRKVGATDVVLPDGGPVTLVVTNEQTANSALVKLSDKPIKLSDKDFVYAQIRVTVQHDGKAVASANVHLKDAVGDHAELLAPESKGEVTFERIHLGKVVGTVEYTVFGAKKLSGELHTTFEAKRDERTPTLAFSIPDKVATVGEAGEGKPVPVPREAQEHTSSVGAIVTIALALVGGLAALGGILYFVQRRKDWVKEKMDRLGVQLPSDPAQDIPTTHTSGFRSDQPPPPPIVPPGTCPFCGGPEGACACVPGAPAASAVSTGRRLLALGGPYAGQAFEPRADRTTVGRDPENDIALDRDSSVSRRHAVIARLGSELAVEDLGSTNGTFVNGLRVQGSQTIRPGDSVQFGESQFKYEA